MKKVLLIVFFIGFSLQSFGQILDINSTANTESSYSLEQLVEDVLITGACSTVDNFSTQVSGTPEQTTTKSYGYFKKNESSSFPFSEGIVLTTGRAFPAGNTLTQATVDNTLGLSGDSDLENALGITGTGDATFVKFNFVPLVGTISFRFLMASEEYDGITECTYADSFAFLLREVGTTTYTNLAVLPDNTPVSVTNINNSSLIDAFPGEVNCDSNIEYFEGYNLRHTNYGGRTKVLTASATVIPNTTYEIKLVVADQGDTLWDSAIFLEAGSFNLGGNLGPDRTIRDGNPACSNAPLELDATIDIPGTTYTWFKDDVEIVGETNAIYNVVDDGTYRVEIDISAGCSSSDEIVVQFTENPVISATPNDILLCEADGDLTEVFDFTDNEALVLGTQDAVNFLISFHSSETDAQTNEYPISNPDTYTNTSPTETIWVRIADATQTCFEIASFNIEVSVESVANQPVDFVLCDDASDSDDTNGSVTFDLSTKISEVLGTQDPAEFKVSFYYTQSEADDATTGTEITTPIPNTTNPQPIYARIENIGSSSCHETTSFNLVVNPLPVVNSVVTLTQCDDDTDGFSVFNLTEANTLISANSANETITYYLTQADAETGTNPILDFTNYPIPTALGSVVYARIENTEGCFRTSQVDLVVSATQIPPTFNLVYEVCDDKLVDNDNTNGIASFDFSDAEQQVKDLFPSSGQNTTVSFYLTEADALIEANQITNTTDFRNELSPNTQQIYVRVDSDVVNACLGLGELITLIVNPLPELNTISDYVLCSDTDLTEFDLTTKNNEVIGSQTEAILVSYHLTEQDAIDNIPITNSAVYQNASNPQQIFVRAQFDKNGNGLADADECFSTDMSFNLIVNHNPTIIQPDDIRICNYQVNTEYDLTERYTQITNGDTSIQLSYFETQLDLDNNNPIPNPTAYINTLLDRDVLVLATGSNECVSTTTLSLKTIIYDNLNENPSPIEECEIDNNGFDFFDITLRETEILDGLNASDFTFTYYENETDAIEGNTSNIPTPTNFENTQQVSQIIYARVQPIANECFIVVPVSLIVNPVPEIEIADEYVICLNRDDEVIEPVNTTFLRTPPIDTRLNTLEYTFQWYNGTEAEVNADPTGTIIDGATEAAYTPTVAGNYTVFATNIATGCRIPASTTVIPSYPPESISIELLSTAFSNNNIIEVTVIGVGEYEYRLDSGSWQSSNVFERLTGGEHTVYVRDLLNCDEVSEVQIVIDYPKYFTPNGDGTNDTWNIKGISSQPNAEIYIFDRYGKLMKQLIPNGSGWDGTINGYETPVDDYWFIVKYIDPIDGIMKEFKSHFSLKR